MNVEVVALTILICAAAIPLVSILGKVDVSDQGTTNSIVFLWVLFPILLGVAIWLNEIPEKTEEQIYHRPIQVHNQGYVGSDACRSCHPNQHATWHASYHRTMTQVVTPDSLMTSVDGLQFSFEDYSFALREQANQVFVNMDLPNEQSGGRMQITRPIVMSTGSHHMQVLWYSMAEDSRLLGMFPYVYLKEQERWIPRGAAFLQPHYSLSGEVGRWNQTCVVCHSTFGRPAFPETVDPRTGKKAFLKEMPDTRVAEFGIGCEACHGPGQEHAQKNRDPLTRYQTRLLTRSDPSITNPGDLPHRLNSQVCGQCHSVQLSDTAAKWISKGYAYRPGDDLDQSKMRSIVRVSDQMNPDLQSHLEENPAFIDDHFWSDGMVRISGREFNGLIESPCYQRGKMSCMSCHDVHQRATDQRPPQEWADDQLGPDKISSQACIQCHQEFREGETLRQHTHHRADSSGSKCYNCHMSYTTYGLLKAIRSHQIDVPSVTSSLQTGRPNACNQCHLDKTLAWTADYLSKWYSIESPELDMEHHEIAASVIWLLRGDAGQRALMAWSFGWEDAQAVSGVDWIAPYLAQLLEDPYAAVRFIAARSLRSLQGYQGLKYDFVGDDQQWRTANSWAFEVWRDSTKKPNPEVLISPDLKLMRTQFSDLLRQRNNRDMTLVE